MDPSETLTSDDAAAFETLIQRAGFEHVHSWLESHGVQTDRIYQRASRQIGFDLQVAKEEIVITQRRGHNGPSTYTFSIDSNVSHDYILARAVMRDMEENPEDWKKQTETISPCCTAGTTTFERTTPGIAEHYDVIAVAGHGTWAHKRARTA